MTHISQTVRQDQRLIMSFAMKRAFAVLQMPLPELSEWLQNELEQNPVLEVMLPSSTPDLSFVSKQDSLYEYLEKEIALHFRTDDEKKIALFIAGSLDSKGFLTLSDKEICDMLGIDQVTLTAVMNQFHQIEPIGLGARSAQEALLLQLLQKGQQKTRLYKLVHKYFDDLLHNRLQVIAKAMHLSVPIVKEMIQKELKKLDPFPGHQFNHEITQVIVPDLTIEKEGDMWKVEVYGEGLPQFHLHPRYLDNLEQEKMAKDELEFVRRHLASGKWLVRTLERRKKILTDIGTYLLKKQWDFLEGITGAPLPLTRKEVATALGISESTVTRAITHKYVTTPRGLLPLAAFFSHAIQTQSGAISNQDAKNLLQKLVQNENKKSPLSDEALSEALKSQGIPCARRTVAKYRKELKIGSKHHRKEWS
ncbi:RNA polymerase factor sigma-54 [Simkania negevensis]|uniref:RNA polymerase sigma-54 factor n=1 Tax=Simkania negevensis (strain ATCC VR-1471 / DSM 27360 / Z) TaxID=331113 RepID=F8L4A0_SIMNZ|nr:RNA polymerase factor sigma-54 [Simkania negevensis]CCB90149.1 rNA polymerase sigma-54 factor [Simkania negevensis Z]